MFYAIITDKESTYITFYYSRASSKEGKSVTCGLPLFIRNPFKLDPVFFCNSESLTEALDGELDFEVRSYLSLENKVDFDRPNLMEDKINTETVAYISKNHQRSMAMDNDEILDETRITKGDHAFPTANKNDELSELTGSTRESKAKAYNMSSDISAKDHKIEQLGKPLSFFRTVPPPKEDSDISYEGDGDENSNLVPSEEIQTLGLLKRRVIEESS